MKDSRGGRIVSDSPDSRMATLLFPTNEPRSKYLEQALRSLGHDVFTPAFDPIDKPSRVWAALATYTRPRMEWWLNFQMHPLVQRRRGEKFAENARAAITTRADGIVMWGSWFDPSVGKWPGGAPPFVQYIDQSRSPYAEEGEQVSQGAKARTGNAEQLATYRRGRAVMCMSEWAVDQTLRAHPTLSKDLVRWAGWGPCAFDLSTEPLATRSEAPLILHVGNDFHRKGADWFCDVARRVRKRRPDVRFVLVGRDQSGTHVDFGSDVEYRGLISDRAELQRLFASAWAFLLPQRFDRSPHVLVEAMSAGVPIVVSQQGGAAELVRDTKVGIGCAVGDIDAYEAAVLRIVEAPTFRDELGTEGKRRVRETYNWTAVATRILDALGIAQ